MSSGGADSGRVSGHQTTSANLRRESRQLRRTETHADRHFANPKRTVGASGCMGPADIVLRRLAVTSLPAASSSEPTVG